MGTDIHLYVEQKQPDGTWRVLPPPERDLVRWPRTPRTEDKWISPFWGPHECMYETECYGMDDNCVGVGCPACLGTSRNMRWYRNRNYDVFAILTGTVRNGHGFAGVVTGDGFRGITDEPRGMPDDITEMVRDHHSWDHSESWLALPEILAFDWSQTTGHTGVIPMRWSDEIFQTKHTDPYVEWRTRKPRIAPTSYSGGIGGPNIIVISAEQADRMLADDAVSTGKSYYVQVSWTETYRESAVDFLAFVDEFLKPLGDPERVRIVFGFDS